LLRRLLLEAYIGFLDNPNASFDPKGAVSDAFRIFDSSRLSEMPFDA